MTIDTVDGLVQLSFVIHGMLENLASEHELSIIQTRLLGILRDRTPSMNELAVLLSLDKSSVSGLVDRAARRGLVERVSSSADRRVVRVRLSEFGRSLVRDVSARFTADIEQLLGGLSPSERSTLTDMMNRILMGHATARGIDSFARGDQPDISGG